MGNLRFHIKADEREKSKKPIPKRIAINTSLSSAKCGIEIMGK
jgi:hypothetical protein